MLKVGLTGGYATGKSFVAAELEKRNCFVIYADKLGHQTLLPDGEAYGAVVQAFGPAILDSEKRIDRKKLGAIVFASPERLAELNSYVHPAVFRLQDRLLAEFAKKEPRGIGVVEAAILIETGRYRMYDRLILTICDEALAVARAMVRDHGSEEQVRSRIRMQMPSEEKRAFADYIIDTGGSELQTVEQVEKILAELRSLL